MNEEIFDRRTARLIPVSGKRGPREREHVTTSAFLAVLREVKEFRDELLKPLGAPSGREVSTLCEVRFDVKPDREARVDGLIRVVRGRKTWTLLVEVKTGKTKVRKDQVEKYLDVVKAEGFDGLLTISNELMAVRGAHPVSVDQRQYEKRLLHHLSWARVLATALRVEDSVKDPVQGWILSELIRYLEDPGSGVLSFHDMGSAWTKLLRRVGRGTLQHGDENATLVAERWEQLLQQISLSLTGYYGVKIRPLLTWKERRDPSIRTAALAREVTTDGTLSGGIAIPGAPGPLEVKIDLKTLVATASITVDAPDMTRPTSRLRWLLRQLEDAPARHLHVTVAFERSRWRTSEPLDDLRRDPKTVLEGASGYPRSFTIERKRELGRKRQRGGRGRQSFIEGCENLVFEFYRDVAKDLKTWTPPKRRRRLRPDHADKFVWKPGDITILSPEEAAARGLTR